jgi:hypothetical protein
MNTTVSTVPLMPGGVGIRLGPRRTSGPSKWLVPAGLIVLSLIPVLAGALRLTELTSRATARG